MITIANLVTISIICLSLAETKQLLNLAIINDKASGYAGLLPNLVELQNLQ